MTDNNIIICRCEDVTLQQIEEAIDSGITDPEELKRFLNLGLGPCQGRTCGRLVNQILSRKTGRPGIEIPATKTRPPLVSVPIKHLIGNEDE